MSFTTDHASREPAQLSFQRPGAGAGAGVD